MKRILLFTVLLPLYFTLSSQDFWMGIQVPDSINEIYNIEISPLDEVVICTEKGLYRSIDDGQSWQSFGNLNRNIYQIVYNEATAYADAGTYLLKSTDYGQSWDSISAYAGDNLSIKIIDDSLLFRVCWGGIFKSSDGGINWTKVHSTTFTQCFYDLVKVDNFLYTSSTAYMVSEDNGVYRSEDYGNSWYLHSLTHHSCRPLCVDIEDNLLAGVAGGWPPGGSPGLYYTDDNGVIWYNLYSSGEVYSMTIDSYGGIYIGLQSVLSFEWGVRYSGDLGLTWENINAGIEPTGYINELKASGKDYIYALVRGDILDTIYRSINPAVKIPDRNKNDSLDINIFPNPTNGIINIEIVNEISGNITLKIYDYMGRMIKIHKLNINLYDRNITLDIEDFISGIYIISIENNQYQRSYQLIKY
ncbi:MAG: T9SS type A sorting domain-containing protein [Bacteroidetes bacterium]|nr:T9SS type A sorting domain-containing protein [Bacteroidota bacterium]